MKTMTKTMILIILMLSVSAVAYSQDAPKEEAYYERITPDGVAEAIEDVLVGRWTPISYTTVECDRWIEEFKQRKQACIEHCDEMIKTWETIRGAVLEEARKVKLQSH